MADFTRRRATRSASFKRQGRLAWFVGCVHADRRTAFSGAPAQNPLFMPNPESGFWIFGPKTPLARKKTAFLKRQPRIHIPLSKYKSKVDSGFFTQKRHWRVGAR
jgi:hypothetical protein